MIFEWSVLPLYLLNSFSNYYSKIQIKYIFFKCLKICLSIANKIELPDNLPHIQT